MKWLVMRDMQPTGCLRKSDFALACRTYYAAFAKVTHELVAARLTMPPDREGPSHARIRPLIETSTPNVQPDKRLKLSELVGRLYTLRIDADYKPPVEVEGRDAREAISIMKTVFESF